MRHAADLEEALFVQMTLGDDRAVRATYAAGRKVYAREDQDERKRTARGKRGLAPRQRTAK